MFSDIFATIFLLLYFWYMTSFPKSFNPSKPTQSAMDPPPRPISHRIRSQGNKFQFLVSGKVAWEHTLPDHYHINNNQFIKLDVCHQQPDGHLVSATGEALYEYVQRDQLVSQNFTFEPNASLVLQDKDIYYFSCQQGRIHQLHMCPPGQFFLNASCHVIDQCAGQKDGKTVADPFDTQRYYECHQEKAISKTCPPDTYFAHDKCYDPLLIGLYCFAISKKPKILDAKTLVACREGKITYEICPPGFRYFNTPKCEPEACVGKPNGIRVPLPHQQIGPLSYSPGYMECLNDKVASTHMCPQEWDSHLSKGDNLTHLPQVFDGKECTIPEFCVNVTSRDPNVIVPVHEFTKHVRNWVFSEAYDRMKGYQCQGTTRKRVAVDPGNIINSKKLKIEPACDSTSERIMVSSGYNQYFNCQTNTLETCPANEYYDGFECRKPMPHAFEYDNLQMFQLDSLREDNWMVPWDYGKAPSVKPCNAPESEYLQTYNVCSHPDCVLYPWLSQIPFQVALRDGSLCTFDEQTRYIKKEATDDKYLYWAQRQVDRIDPNEKCTPGQNIQSGHFVFDKTIFATCDDAQPFVFCPSSSTDGITLVHGKPGVSFWACVPPGMKGIIPPNTTVSFNKNEVKRMLPTSVRVTEVLINGNKIMIPPLGVEETDRFQLQTLDEPIEVIYEYRITHPPEVAWPGQVSNFSGAFLIKAKDFTRKEVKIPRYEIKDSLIAFKLT